MQLVHRVQERLLLLANPAAPPLVGRAGNQEEWTGQPSVDQEEGQFEFLTVEMLQVLQQEQVSVEGFCLALLSHGVRAVKGAITEGLDQGVWPLLGTVSQLMCGCVELLQACCAGEGGLDAGHDTVRAQAHHGSGQVGLLHSTPHFHTPSHSQHMCPLPPPQVRSTVKSVFDLLAQCLCKWRRWLAAARLASAEMPQQLIHCLLLCGCTLAGLRECMETSEKVSGQWRVLARGRGRRGHLLLVASLLQPSRARVLLS